MKTERLMIRITSFDKQQLKQESERRVITQFELIISLIARLPEPQKMDTAG
ncbi:CopG family transcriptional regulator [Moorena producens PAL-8-15-08-1]|uniref:CopG family transcriptional regulator n=1 Tax=Moorena producens PAL-8-15-08-1 TaxID=1458985 RepID=A0A1D8TSD3_9CYAN|nr:CopG family transcriptional regulator [Moorena producens PAL-8-15-08-1]